MSPRRREHPYTELEIRLFDEAAQLGYSVVVEQTTDWWTAPGRRRDSESIDVNEHLSHAASRLEELRQAVAELRRRASVDAAE